MNEPVDNRDNTAATSRLADAIRDVKNAFADRDDVVVDIREAQLTRLELLADDLKQVFADIPNDDERFDLAISSGSQPRLWIDSVAHVTMGRDRRTYRFLRDTRLGRVVLCESTDLSRVAEQVTRYIAGRMIERQRMLEGDVDLVRTDADEDDIVEDGETGGRTGGFLRGVGMVLLGGLVGAGLILLLASALGTGFSL
ncbi:hypothetical protein [Mesorhizobium sp. CAU 1741]|uniref:hypothetical protein n=1 Tax=Mesorhizobium sp. CAU 1741 TaxID=3140366 RepID=UPI00325BC3CB